MIGHTGVVGAGAMGSGIAQIAAQSGCKVTVCDANAAALQRAENNLRDTFRKLAEKGKMRPEDAEAASARLHFTTELTDLSTADLIIEAIVENLDVKKQVFATLDELTGEQCILASNTSSLSITAIAGACKRAHRVMGIHFFNPAPLMPLVELIPAVQTDADLPGKMKQLMLSWGKTPVIARDTPGFIVNRVARPFYGEALRIFEEGIADMATIDAAMRDLGFRMGPFELMDLIGNDVNYAVTESVFTAFYFDPRFKPSFTQKRLVEAGWYGRKTGRGYYNYAEGTPAPVASEDAELRKRVSQRILFMLINEAYEALYLGIASAGDLDTAMTRGVNYPKGLIEWGKELGTDTVVEGIRALREHYMEDRYRVSAGLRAQM